MYIYIYTGIHINISPHRQHESCEHGELLLWHAAGLQLERHEHVEGGERSLGGEEHQRERAHRRKLRERKVKGALQLLINRYG